MGSIKRGIPWPAGRKDAQKVRPYPVWEVFRETTLKKYFPNSTFPIQAADESLFREYYIARRSYQRGERGANETMALWRKRVEAEKGEVFYIQYQHVLEIIRDETTTRDTGKERKR